MSIAEGRRAERDRDSLAYLLRVVRRRWIVLVLSVAACVGIAIIASARSSKSYDSSSRVLFGTSRLSDAALQVDRSANDPEREAATNVLLARSEAVADNVRKKLGLSESTASLLEQVSAEAEENANIVRITVSDADPRRAARLAQTFAQEFIAFRAQGDVQSIQAAEDDLRAQLRSLPANSGERQALEDSLQRLTQLRALATGDARIISAAEVPTSPANAGPLQILVLAIVIGGALGLAGMFLLESVDRRISDIEGFEEGYQLRALTVVPQRAFRVQAMEARSAELEPYRILRTALEFARVTRPFRALLVTSAIQGEGKTTVAIDLAHAIALSGRPVVLVELDLRRPSFASHFDLPLRTGVTTALLGRSPVSELVQRPVSNLEHFGVLAGGPLPPNPAELLEAPALDGILRELLEDEEVTLVLDAPPLLPVADAQVLLNQPAVDGCIVVAREGVTTRDQMRRARVVLDSHVVVPFGIVVTGHAARDVYGYGYEQGAYDETPGSELDAAPLPPGSGQDAVPRRRSRRG
jgi:capsular exopolysaccharide synthesis family protein